MSNTRDFFETVRNYRKELGEAWGDYENRMEQIKQYAGSAGYSRQAEQFEKDRQKAIAGIQSNYAGKFDKILQSMRENACNKSMVPPTQEQINLLTALKMREKISRNELEQAGRTLKNSPVALSILGELAAKYEYYGLHFGAESTSEIMEHINTLADSARRLCKLDKPNSRREMAARADIHSPLHVPNALYSFQVDKDIDSEREMMRIYGSVSDYGSFSDAVNE